MSRTTLFRTVLWAVIALLGGAALALALMRNTPLTSGEAAYGTPFQLTDQNGAPVTEAVFKGRPSAVFFGFTHCPDVCPTTLSELGAYREQLKSEGKHFQIVFVTVDPERDTADAVKTYVDAISSGIVGITGDPARLAAMLKGWGIYSKKVGEGEDYTMDHTATTFLLDSAGRFVGTIAYDENPKTALDKLERLAVS